MTMRTLEFRNAVFCEVHPDTLETMGILAVYSFENPYSWSTVLEKQENILGVDDPQTLNSALAWKFGRANVEGHLEGPVILKVTAETIERRKEPEVALNSCLV